MPLSNRRKSRTVLRLAGIVIIGGAGIVAIAAYAELTGVDVARILSGFRLATKSAQMTSEPFCERCNFKMPAGQQCKNFYQQMLQGGDSLGIGVGVGYLEPKLGDQPTINVYNTITSALTGPCKPDEQEPEHRRNGRLECKELKKVNFACGFARKKIQGTAFGLSVGTSYEILSKKIKIDGKTMHVNLPICNPDSPSRDPGIRKQQQQLCKILFKRSLGNDQVTLYTGHSRYGYGPGLNAPQMVSKGQPYRDFSGKLHRCALDYCLDKGYYKANRPNKDVFTAESFRPAPPNRAGKKIVAMSSCDSHRHYSAAARAASVKGGYENGNLTFIGSQKETFSDGQEVLRTIEAIGSGECRRGLKNAFWNNELGCDHRFTQYKLDAGDKNAARYTGKTLKWPPPGGAPHRIYRDKMPVFKNNRIEFEEGQSDYIVDKTTGFEEFKRLATYDGMRISDRRILEKDGRKFYVFKAGGYPFVREIKKNNSGSEIIENRIVIMTGGNIAFQNLVVDPNVTASGGLPE